MARRRKPGRPKGSKNKKRKTTRKRKATPAQLRNLKKARAVRAKNLKKAGKKAGKKRGRKSATYHKRVENLKKARAARELKNMPKTRRLKRNALAQLYHDVMAETVRAPLARHPNPHVAELYSKRRRADTLVSAT